eukprot:6194106-Pleurochrysis_carterae.AAC.1
MEEKGSGEGDGRSADIKGEETTGRGESRLDEINGENQREHLLEIHIGTLNVSGIAYGYRGKYINTEEDLLKIRPGDKLREVVEMMKTQGISLLALTDTHLGREGIQEVGTYLRQEGMDGGGIAAKKESGEEDTPGVRKKAGIYYIWNPIHVSVQDITEVYESRVARAR